jgi:FHS family Na+ dependent glucose MFS transporter 1
LPDATSAPDRQSSRLRHAQTAVYYLGFLGIGLMDASLGPTLGWLADRCGSRPEALGILFTARSLGYVMGSYVTGRLYDRLPGHALMALGLGASAGALAAVPGASAVISLAAVLFAAGAGVGALDVGGNTLLAWIHGARVGALLNGLHFCFGVGSLIAPVIVAQIFARKRDVAWAYWGFAATMAVIAVAIAAVPSPPTRARARDRESSRWFHGPRLMWLVAASLAMYVGVELGFGGWLFTFATARYALSASDAAYLTSLYWAAFTAGRLIAIPVISRFSVRRMLDVALGGAAVALVVLLASPLGAGLWTGCVLLGFFSGPIFPTLIAAAEQRLELTGHMTSVFLVSAGVGGMVVPWLMGAVMQKMGAGALLPAVAADLAVLLALYAVMTPLLRS